MKFENTDAERSLIGVILLDSVRIIPKVSELITHRDFSNPSYARMYQGITALYAARTPVDVLTLAEWLKRHHLLEAVGGSEALTVMTNDVVTSTNVVEHAKIIADMSLRRRLIATTKAINEIAEKEEHIEELLNKSEAAIMSVNGKKVVSESFQVGEILTETLVRIEAAQNGEIQRGVSTGYREADRILTGLHNSDLIILAARPAMGKTAYGLNLARNIAITQGVPTLVFSLEMSKDQLVDRLLAMETGIPTENLRYGQLAEAELLGLTDVMGRIAEAPLYIDDTPNVTIQHLRARARREHHVHHIGLIIVDYLQLMSGHGKKDGNREQEISEISRGLKIIARELQVPVVALSQLSRQVEAREVKLPQLSDLRESGSIEQNADIVAFLYRDDYYNPDSKRPNMTDLLIRKHRNGRTGTIELYFDRQHQLFRGVCT